MKIFPLCIHTAHKPSLTHTMYVCIWLRFFPFFPMPKRYFISFLSNAFALMRVIKDEHTKWKGKKSKRKKSICWPIPFGIFIQCHHSLFRVRLGLLWCCWHGSGCSSCCCMRLWLLLFCCYAIVVAISHTLFSVGMVCLQLHAWLLDFCTIFFCSESMGEGFGNSRSPISTFIKICNKSK